jgi:hypothetical protein
LSDRVKSRPTGEGVAADVDEESEAQTEAAGAAA